jgi:hypothetical protein
LIKLFGLADINCCQNHVNGKSFEMRRFRSTLVEANAAVHLGHVEEQEMAPSGTIFRQGEAVHQVSPK